MPNWFTCGVSIIFVAITAGVAYAAVDMDSDPLKIVAVMLGLAACVLAFRVGRR